jgi:hypothetical protein
MATDYAANIVLLEDALARGELTIEANGERITYKSTTDLVAAINYNRNRLSREPQTTFVVFDR